MNADKTQPTAAEIADAVVRYAEAYGLYISYEANQLWDLIEKVATRLPPLFAIAKKPMD